MPISSPDPSVSDTPDHDQRALTLARPSAALTRVCLALGLQAKNLEPRV